MLLFFGWDFRVIPHVWCEEWQKVEVETEGSRFTASELLRFSRRLAFGVDRLKQKASRCVTVDCISSNLVRSM